MQNLHGQNLSTTAWSCCTPHSSVLLLGFLQSSSHSGRPNVQSDNHVIAFSSDKSFGPGWHRSEGVWGKYSSKKERWSLECCLPDQSWDLSRNLSTAEIIWLPQSSTSNICHRLTSCKRYDPTVCLHLIRTGAEAFRIIRRWLLIWQWHDLWRIWISQAWTTHASTFHAAVWIRGQSYVYSQAFENYCSI